MCVCVCVVYRGLGGRSEHYLGRPALQSPLWKPPTNWTALHSDPATSQQVPTFVCVFVQGSLRFIFSSSGRICIVVTWTCPGLCGLRESGMYLYSYFIVPCGICTADLTDRTVNIPENWVRLRYAGWTVALFASGTSREWHSLVERLYMQHHVYVMKVH